MGLPSARDADADRGPDEVRDDRGARPDRDLATTREEDAAAGEQADPGPDELPSTPYERIPVEEYHQPTLLGRRSGVYQASIGCPYGCNFCGVISVFGSREKQQAPARTAAHLAYLAHRHGMD